MPLDSRNLATTVGRSKSIVLKVPSMPASGGRGGWCSHRRVELLPEGLDAASHFGSKLAELDAGWWLRWVSGDLDRVCLVTFTFSPCLECLVAIVPRHRSFGAEVTDQVRLVALPANCPEGGTTSLAGPGVTPFTPAKSEAATGPTPHRAGLSRDPVHLGNLPLPVRSTSSQRLAPLSHTKVTGRATLCVLPPPLCQHCPAARCFSKDRHGTAKQKWRKLTWAKIGHKST